MELILVALVGGVTAGSSAADVRTVNPDGIALFHGLEGRADWVITVVVGHLFPVV